jgi:CBS domain-containing protein
MKVKDVMTREVVTVSPDALLKEAAILLVEHRISGLPVVDGDGRLHGVVSGSDLLVKEQGEPGGGWLRWLVDPMAVADRVKLDAHLVREAMTAPALTIGPERRIAAAAKLMLAGRVHRLPVVAGGSLVGIVSRSDLVRAFARSDDDIAAEIREDVLGRSLMLEPGRVRVDVSDGEVSLKGSTETEEDAAALARLTAQVPGVVEVHSELASRG